MIRLRKEYKTVLNSASAELIEKKSRFIASVKPVESEEQAIGFLNQIRSQRRDARHNVYAYSIGGSNIVQRYSDDGEPAGTAGIPVLEAIKKSGVDDVAVVVTRYFGGILLGTGGLTRAYGKAAAMGIEAAEIVKRVLCRELLVQLNYSQLGKVQGAVIEAGFHIGKVLYEGNIKMQVFAPAEDEKHLIQVINDATGGTAEMETAGEGYITLGADGKIVEGYN